MAEFDSAKALAKSEVRSLAAFLAEGAEPARLWRPEEIAAVFHHQMAAPILVDLAGFDPATARRLPRLAEAQALVLKSFADLFRHPLPPLELLELTKQFAKANMDHPESVLPGEVASVLYYASIASALVRLGRRISRLADADLRRGFRWALERPWLDSETRALMEQAMQKLSA
ncbi:MAG TPA: hypothetical protein VHB20_08545 [Verrucomicrobiae bacterium]|nr:hypothetical protein [Verrucomicrobiae bacterium]